MMEFCKMNFSIRVLLLHILVVTIPSSVLASKVNETRTITRTATIVSETCNDRFCYNLTEESPSQNQSDKLAPHHEKFDRFRSTSVLYGIVKIASERSESNQCTRELNKIYDGIHKKEIWAIKALDSSGMPASGFVLGHNFWMGSTKGCEAVQNPPPLTISNRFHRFMHAELWSSTAPFEIEYRMVYAEHRSPWQVQVEFLLEKNKVLHIGLCLPMSCSNNEIANLTQEYFNSSILDAQIMHDYLPNVLKVKNFNSQSTWMNRRSFQIVAFCVAFTVLMIITAAVKDSANEASEKLSSNKQATTENTTARLHSNPPDVVLHCTKTRVQKTMFFDEVIECFSLRKNIQILTNVKKSANAVPIVDGLKSIGCFLILMFHVYWFNHFTVHNVTMTFSYGEQALYQWISAIPIIVDVFFTISGLLLSYNFLRNQSKIEEIRTNTFMQNLKLFGKQLLNRYIRLTPMYLVVVGFVEFSTSQLVENSLFWVQDRNDVMCNKYWWRNLLYIQNLFSQDELCVNWSWSLACEMQFFIVSTILLFIYAKYPNAAKAIFFSLFGIFVGLVVAIAIFTKFTPAYDVMHSLGTDMYIAPWTRILPYLIGVGAGYIMFILNGVMPLGENKRRLLWTVMITIAISAHCSTLHRDITHILAAPLITFIRVFYPASISWMIIASHTGHGGSFAKILNHPIFVHINKLTFGIYLLNPLVINVIYGWQDHSTHVDPVSMLVMTTGIKVIVYLTAIVFSLMFEIPYTNLSAKLLKQSSIRKTVTPIEAKKVHSAKKEI